MGGGQQGHPIGVAMRPPPVACGLVGSTRGHPLGFVHRAASQTTPQPTADH